MIDWYVTFLIPHRGDATRARNDGNMISRQSKICDVVSLHVPRRKAVPFFSTPVLRTFAVAAFLTIAGCTSFPTPFPDSGGAGGWGGYPPGEAPPPPPETDSSRAFPDEETVEQQRRLPIPPDVPTPMREFRGVWIATVDNIDWPSRRDLTTREQRAELRTLFDRIDEAGFNAVIFQVRPAADALYESDLEPWSEYLTGTQGQAPQPYYDPLKLAIELAHERGLELHAWFNPYRVTHPTAAGPRASTHASQAQSDIVREYGDYEWFDPGEPRAADHSLSVIMDVVRRYDVDGVHFDDYFYPYPITRNGRRIPFPDDDSYRRSGTSLSRDDWRRENVNRFVERVYREVKAAKPWVKVGISPFGIWRPGHPPSVRGFDQYAEIYADARLWQQEGWLDYFAPQLYWRIDEPGQRFPDLLDWWADQNTAGRHLWPGLFTGRIRTDTESTPWNISEILTQIDLVRENRISTGAIHFSAKSIRDNSRGIATRLANDTYTEPALVPESPWLGDEPPRVPSIETMGTGGSTHLALTPTEGPEPFLWVIRAQRNGVWTLQIEPNTGTTIRLPGPTPDLVVVSGVSRTGIEGEMTAVEVE